MTPAAVTASAAPARQAHPETAVEHAARALAAAIRSSEPGAAAAIDHWQDELRRVDHP